MNSINLEGKDQSITFIETTQVVDGVDCDVYSFSDDTGKDLGIIKISAGSKTPLQKVLKGDRTIEGFISGKGKLTITGVDGKKKVYLVDERSKKSFSILVKIDESMQWKADSDKNLIAYEICYPPYEDGRFENKN